MTEPDQGFIYLTADQLIAINADQEGAVGVGDRNGVEANAQRPQSGAFGVEAFPDIWLKAAAYVHGIASSQYFTDGNKRTAWYAATTFLELNGQPMPPVLTIEAEVFVQAIAQDVFRTDDEPDATVIKAAEWFQAKWEMRHEGASTDPLLEWAFLAVGASFPPDDIGGLVNVDRGGFRTLQVGGESVESAFPVASPLTVVARLWWDRAAHTTGHVMTATVVSEAGNTAALWCTPGRFDVIPSQFVHTIDPHYASSRLRPLIFYFELQVVFYQPGDFVVVVRRDDTVVAELPLTVLYVGAEF